MRNYSYTAAFAVLFVIALAVSAFANGATPDTGLRPAPGIQQTSPAGTGTGAATPVVPTKETCYSMDQLVTLTVAQAWDLSGGSYSVFQQMVAAMTDFSADKRALDIPNTKEAGMEIGELVRKKAEADPNQLLYAAVDSSVRDYAAKHNIKPLQ